MENKKTLTCPQKVLSNTRLVHFALILSNLSIFGLSLAIGSVLSTALIVILLVLWILFLVLALIGTFGVVYVAFPNYLSYFSATEKILDFFKSFSFDTFLVYDASISLACGIASILLLCFDKQKNFTARIVGNVIVCVALVAVMLITILGGAK